MDQGATLYSGATGIAVDAAHIYWTDGNRYPQGRPAGTKLVPGTKRTLRLVLKPKKPKRKR